jgi:hypothetical protein
MVGRVFRFIDGDMTVCPADVDEDIPGQRLGSLDALPALRKKIGSVVLGVPVLCTDTEIVIVGFQKVDALRAVGTVEIDADADSVVEPRESFAL